MGKIIAMVLVVALVIFVTVAVTRKLKAPDNPTNQVTSQIEEDIKGMLGELLDN